MQQLAGCVGIVTGGGRGLGRAFALHLSRAGAVVVVNNRNRVVDAGGRGPADHVVAEIRAAGGEAVADHGDVAEPGTAAALVRRALELRGRLVDPTSTVNGAVLVCGGGGLRGGERRRVGHGRRTGGAHARRARRADPREPARRPPGVPRRRQRLRRPRRRPAVLNPPRRVTVLEEGGPNAIAAATGIVGDEWTLWIVQKALAGLTQYSEYLHAGPISSAVLTARLARLVEADVLERVAYTARPVRHDYRLTDRGRQMWPILLTMWAWERTWVSDPAGRVPAMRHTTCGAAFDPVPVCAACDREIVAREVTGRFGPSGSWARSIPSATTRRRSHAGSRPDELVVQTMAMIGNRWSTALLGAAFFGATRFGEFEQRMGAPPTIVAERLRGFRAVGVLEAAPNPQRPDWTVYHLTAKGRAFFPVMASVIEWGQHWFLAPEGPAVRLEHTACGGAFHPRLRCGACRERLRGAAVQIVRDGGGTRREVG